MNRLFVSAALLPLVWAASAQAETKITTAVTTPVKTSTATAAGAPDDLTIDSAGSVKPTAAGAAVTLDSNNKVSNLGTISFNGVNGATASWCWAAGRAASTTPARSRCWKTTRPPTPIRTAISTGRSRKGRPASACA